MNKPLTTLNITSLGWGKRRVRVYWNLTRKCWSVLDSSTKRLIGHHRGVLWLAACAFPVSQAGRERVLRERRKNVHAFVEGVIMAPHPTQGYTAEAALGTPDTTVSYNPYKAGYFTRADGGAITGCSVVAIGNDDDHADRTIRAWGTR